MRTFKHDHPARVAWDILVLAAIISFVLVISYRAVFRIFEIDFFYCFLYAIFAVDIWVNFNSRVKVGHIRHETRGEIRRYYLSSWFPLDLVAALPLEIIFFLFWHPEPGAPAFSLPVLILQSFTLIKVFKVRRLFNELQEALGIIPAVRRLVTMAYTLLISIHLIAVGWILIGATEAFRPPFDQYLRAVYWVTTTLMTIGYGDYYPNHDSNIQIAYTIVTQLFGAGIFSFVIANISSLLSNLDIAKSDYQRRLDEVNAYLRAQRIPGELQQRVRDYYSYLWERQRGVSASKVLDGIPRNLSQEILMFLNREVLNRVELFKGAEDLFMREIVQLLKPRIFLPGEFVIREGEYGDSMYFLTSGEVVVSSKGTEIARLGSGSPFGEMALVENLHRNASIASVSYSMGYQLMKDDFDALMAKYPDFHRQVKEVVNDRKRNG